MKERLIRITPELSAAIDEARRLDNPVRPTPLGAFGERALWRLLSIKRAASSAGVSKPTRPVDGRGMAKAS